jgi:hypothetical protein
MLDACWALFELELYRDPARRPNDVWSAVTESGLGIEPHPEWSWWAMRGQLIDSPGYLANYVLSALIAAALRASCSSCADRGGTATRAGSVRDGAPVRPGLVAAAIGAARGLPRWPLTAAPLLADLRRATV